MDEERFREAQLLDVWRDAVQAAELAERLAGDAADAARQADRHAIDSAEIARLARDVAASATRAAERAELALDEGMSPEKETAPTLPLEVTEGLA